VQHSSAVVASDGLHRLPDSALPAVKRARDPLEDVEVAIGRRLEEPPLQQAGTAGEGRRHGWRLESEPEVRVGLWRRGQEQYIY